MSAWAFGRRVDIQRNNRKIPIKMEEKSIGRHFPICAIVWYYAYQLTGSFWDGLVLGSSLSTVVVVVATFIFMAFTAGISVAFSGLVSIFNWIKNINK